MSSRTIYNPTFLITPCNKRTYPKHVIRCWTQKTSAWFTTSSGGRRGSTSLGKSHINDGI